MPLPAGAQPGLDVSHYQGAIDWTAVSTGGYVYDFAKASEGVNSADEYFAANWPAIKAAGLLRGAYHYFHPSMDGQTQADYFLQCLSEANGGTAMLAQGDLPVALDLEVTEGVVATDLMAGATVWLQAVQTATGRQPLVYTGPDFWTSIRNPADLSGYPLWIAHLTSAPSPTVPSAWANWFFWQYDQQPVGGIPDSAVVDLDAFNGTLHDLQSMAGF
jgi:lysozyme